MRVYAVFLVLLLTPLYTSKFVVVGTGDSGHAYRQVALNPATGELNVFGEMQCTRFSLDNTTLSKESSSAFSSMPLSGKAAIIEHKLYVPALNGPKRYVDLGNNCSYVLEHDYGALAQPGNCIMGTLADGVTPVCSLYHGSNNYIYTLDGTTATLESTTAGSFYSPSYPVAPAAKDGYAFFLSSTQGVAYYRSAPSTWVVARTFPNAINFATDGGVVAVSYANRIELWEGDGSPSNLVIFQTIPLNETLVQDAPLCMKEGILYIYYGATDRYNMVFTQPLSGGQFDSDGEFLPFDAAVQCGIVSRNLIYLLARSGTNRLTSFTRVTIPPVPQENTTTTTDTSTTDGGSGGGSGSLAGVLAGVGGSTAFLVCLVLCCCCCCFLIILFLVLLIAIILVILLVLLAAAGGLGGGALAFWKLRGSSIESQQHMLVAHEMEHVDGTSYRELSPKEIAYKEKIGEGNYGVVFKGKWRSVDVAVKQLHRVQLEEAALAEFRHEAEIMGKLGSHPNVCQFIGAVTKGAHLMLVTKFYPNGSLQSMLIEKKEDVTLLGLVTMARDVACGLHHLHEENVVHRDIAARNCLVDADYTVVVSDFGTSRFFEVEGQEVGVTNTTVGPVKWMAPEAIRERQYSKASDSWSFGCLLYEMWAREKPFNGITLFEAMKIVRKRKGHVEIPSDAEPVFKEIMEGVFKQDPSARLTMAAALELLDDRVVELGGDPLAGHQSTLKSSSSFAATEVEDSGYGTLNATEVDYVPADDAVDGVLHSSSVHNEYILADSIGADYVAAASMEGEYVAASELGN